jgi:ComF family protein
MARSAFLFDGPARAAVLKLKFAGEGSVARALGKAMSAVGEELLPVEAVTWVPLSRKRLATRGYDQARLLARYVSDGTGVPARRLLVRVRDIPPQAKSGRRERMEAVKGLFVARPPIPRSVLLVDDVLTTGATAGECARVLEREGARRVLLLTAARTLLAGPQGPGGAVLSSVRFQSGSVVARGVSPR